MNKRSPRIKLKEIALAFNTSFLISYFIWKPKIYIYNELRVCDCDYKIIKM